MSDRHLCFIFLFLTPSPSIITITDMVHMVAPSQETATFMVNSTRSGTTWGFVAWSERVCKVMQLRLWCSGGDELRISRAKGIQWSWDQDGEHCYWWAQCDMVNIFLVCYTVEYLNLIFPSNIHSQYLCGSCVKSSWVEIGAESKKMMGQFRQQQMQLSQGSQLLRETPIPTRVSSCRHSFPLLGMLYCSFFLSANTHSYS